MVMITGNNNETPRAVLASKSIKYGQSTSSSIGSLSLSNGKSGMSSKSQTSSDGIKCSHCGNSEHTHENCFKLHGYPDQAQKHHDKAETKGEPVVNEVPSPSYIAPRETSTMSLPTEIETSIPLVPENPSPENIPEVSSSIPPSKSNDMNTSAGFSSGTKMALTNFILTVAGVSAVILLLRSDVKQSAAIFRRNVKHIRTWLEEESSAAAKSAAENAKPKELQSKIPKDIGKEDKH
ncbi:hypothetical protein RJ641_022566 [Dillenia turbinata]|uniref:Uncharacterized protein n=1 Tax=Dillenia turbinata TaxID=194707 RepID=A0AAN8UCQ7_9MAGN